LLEKEQAAPRLCAASGVQTPFTLSQWLELHWASQEQAEQLASALPVLAEAVQIERLAASQILPAPHWSVQAQAPQSARLGWQLLPQQALLVKSQAAGAATGQTPLALEQV